MQRSGAHSIRTVRQTALIYCEGAHDAAFINLVKLQYAGFSQTGTRFKVMTGQGGSPDSLVREMLRIPASYDRYLLKVDADRAGSERQLAESLAKESDKSISFCWSVPCLESLLLSMLLPGEIFTSSQSSLLKQRFEKEYVPTSKRSNRRSYEQHFPKQLLDSARQRVAELDDLICFFEL